MMLGSPLRIKQIGALRKGLKIPRLHLKRLRKTARIPSECGLFCAPGKLMIDLRCVEYS